MLDAEVIQPLADLTMQPAMLDAEPAPMLEQE